MTTRYPLQHFFAAGFPHLGKIGEEFFTEHDGAQVETLRRLAIGCLVRFLFWNPLGVN